MGDVSMQIYAHKNLFASFSSRFFLTSSRSAGEHMHCQYDIQY